MKPNSENELLDLIDRSCDERCDDVTIERLEEVLRANPASVQLYVKYRDMHSALHSLAAANIDSPDPRNNLSAICSVETPSSNSYRKFWNTWGFQSYAMIAASLLFLAVGFSYGRFFKSERSNTNPAIAEVTVANDDDDLLESDGVARVTGLVDCKWSAGHQPLYFGKAVTGGERIELAEGLVQLTFSQGAKVIVQGPARFVPHSKMDATLEHGKLSAVVPEQARGYTVTTPTAQIVDLGTEFALDVADDGATEVHVMKGDVVARRRQSDGQLQGEALHARKLNALRFARNTSEAQWIDAEPDKFARQITPKLTSEQLPALPVTQDLKLWLAADLLVSRDTSGRVSAWRDVCIGDNQMSNDACQFDELAQPIWVENDGYGRPAIRFNGDTTRLFTDSFTTGNRITVFVAFRPDQRGQDESWWGGHLLNFGGYAPTVELGIRNSDLVHTGLYATDAVGVGIKAGVIKNKTIPRSEPCVLTYTYDLAADRAEQWLNGVSSGHDSASLIAKTESSRTIGGHGKPDIVDACYRGDIHEVLIYDTALDEPQLHLTIDYLMDRYVSPEEDAQAKLNEI